mgnify:FL=1|tara:strand:+ start:3099 stop:3419 length:321 start_codon:yes stop_codon:yes gene_type:complete
MTSRKDDIKLTLPNISDVTISRALIGIVEAVNNLLSEQEILKNKVKDDARRTTSVDSKLDEIGRLRIKKVSEQEYSIQARTEMGWKDLKIYDDAGGEVSNRNIRLK